MKELDQRQAAGEGMQFSMHIYREIRWWLNFTPDMETTRARIADLRQSLGQPVQQKLAAEQQASDGSWGLGLNVWYLKLYYSVEDGLSSRGPAPQFPLHFLDRINSPGTLTAQLTGCWGQWLVDRQGRIWKMDDMGMTFHVVSDLHGQVAHQDLIARRLLQLDSVNFPAGIRFNGHYENHLNMDAVKIFRSAWPTLDAATRQQVRSEISRMLDWCLTHSYQSDGSFKMSDLDDTVGDAYSYGVDFLRETGYFRRSDRFWTDQDFPQAKVVHDRIEAKLKSIGFNDPGLRDAYDSLHALD